MMQGHNQKFIQQNVTGVQANLQSEHTHLSGSLLSSNNKMRDKRRLIKVSWEICLAEQGIRITIRNVGPPDRTGEKEIHETRTQKLWHATTAVVGRKPRRYLFVLLSLIILQSVSDWDGDNGHLGCIHIGQSTPVSMTTGVTQRLTITSRGNMWYERPLLVGWYGDSSCFHVSAQTF